MVVSKPLICIILFNLFFVICYSQQIKTKTKNPSNLHNNGTIKNAPEKPNTGTLVINGNQIKDLYSIKLNQADVAAYNQANDNWVQVYSTPMPDNHILKFTYTLQNKIATKPGKIIGDVDGTPLVVPHSFTNIVTALAPNQNFQSAFQSNPLSPGKHLLHLKYITQGLRVIPLTGMPGTYDSLAAAAEFNYVINVTVTLIDEDNDGIDDRIEARLLEKFRPYYKFTLNRGNDVEEYRPTDALSYIQQSDFYGNDVKIFDHTDMATGPKRMISFFTSINNSSDIGSNPQLAKFRLKPVVEGTKNGAAWDNKNSRGNVGLYGHVVPIRLKQASDYDRHAIPSGSDQNGLIFYKIEYWQFYGYNEDHAGILGEHEGDWTTVQLIYDPRGGENEDSIAYVLYYEHGALEIRFNMFSNKYAKPYTMTNSTDQFITYQGRNHGKDCAGGPGINSDDCNNNTLIFSKDPISQRFTHPVVYIENGAHEPWPTSSGKFSAASGHNGDDESHSYLTTTPPNLGEVDHPSLDVNGAFEILRYNGRWGKDGAGGPPQGPILHWEWTWPANSSIRWKISANHFSD